ncbi:EAL domain-containing protein [Deinococcus radiotolerans]|uniref:Diguanylate cyclase/phosphodiesterase with PAS/PAC and GAF sensor(S) n=1 Tax=Deinococcus radiotolerans TaxID=1309407 RepID=A0ABQ2FMT6_9DEIO|nr:EAL domain-containing protein [Deinococcus radiotolerans]GGL08121.1 hypothetical protein GCM10010844_28620 [Deinococcus radiotolerans]
MAEPSPLPSQHFLELISDGYMVLDREWRYLYLNQVALRVLKRRAEDLLGRVIWAEYPDTAERFGAPYRQAMEERTAVEFEEYYPPLDLWTHLRVLPVPEGVGVLFRDVTQAKRSAQYQQRLLALNTLLNAAAALDDVAQAILEFARSDWGQYGGVVALASADGRTLSITHHVGYEAPLMRRWASFPVQLDVPLARVQRTGEPLFLSSEAARAQFSDLHDQTSFQSFTCLPLRVGGGPVLGVLAFSFEQLRRFDQLERTFFSTLAAHCAQALHRARLFEEARRSELRYRLLTEATSAFTWTSDTDLRVTEPQPGWSAYTGQSGAQTLGFGWLRAVHPADRADVQRQIARGQQSGGPFRLRGRVRRSDGAYRAVVSDVVPIHAAQRESPVLMGVVQDVTDELERTQVLTDRHRLIEVLAQDTDPDSLLARVVQETAQLLGAQGVMLLACPDGAAPCEVLAHWGAPIAGPLPSQPGAAPGERGAWQAVPGAPRTHLLILPTQSQWTAALLITLPDELSAADPRPARLQDLSGVLGAAVQRAGLLRDLAERDAQSRSIIAALDEGVILIREDGESAALNSSARQMLNVPEAAPHRALTDLHLLGPDRRPLAPERLPTVRALQGERIHREVVGHEAGGAVTWWSLNAAPLPTPRGEGLRQAVISAQDVTPQVTLQAELERLAAHDDLTGLPNRRAFAAQGRAALRQTTADGAPLAVMLVDLDHFKDINDALGHGVGDEVLRTVAARLRTWTGPEGVAARLSSDEFGVFLPVTDPHEAHLRAEQLRGALGGPVTLGGYDLHLAVSIGVTLAPTDADTFEDLLRNADLAMYRAKGSGRSSVGLFDLDLSRQRARRHAVSVELRGALDRGALHLQYQPIQTLREGHLLAAEALARWHSPLLGRVGPDEFIPVAEETGQILQLGEWVLNQAVQQAAAWRRAGRRVQVSVNVSPLQFLHSDFAQVTRAALDAAGLPPDLLQLEITESAVMRDVHRTRHQCEQLRALGVQLALDDFGTGHSSLATLHTLDFHVLKLDRAFVWGLEGDPRREALLRSVVTLAQSLSMDIVAEGIETAAQRRLLIDLGCRLGQGYHLARPLDVPDFERTFLNRA